jgi:hypothetical protein
MKFTGVVANLPINLRSNHIIHLSSRFKLPEGVGKITHLGTCFRCVVVATEDGKLYFKNKFMREENENMSTGV